MAKEMGDVVRFKPASQPLWAAFLILVVTAVVVVNAVLFIVALQMGLRDPMEEQRWQAVMLGNVFLGLAMVLMLYRRYFMDDVLIVKKRHPKYEDFLEKYDIE